jgi:hypothetical protein
VRLVRRIQRHAQRRVCAALNFLFAAVASFIIHGGQGMPKAPSTQDSPFNLQQLYASAEAMRETSSLVTRQTPLGFFAIPSAMLGALTLELFFKLLILLEGKSYRGIHDLESLFKQLTVEHQNEIKACFEREELAKVKQTFELIAKADGPSPDVTVDFEYCLSSSADTFVKYRYDYESLDGRGKLSNWIAGGMIDCVKAIVLRFHPEWKDQARDFKKII